MIVLGVDPGTAATGYGVVRAVRGEAPVLLECGVVRTDPHDELPGRLRDIHRGIAAVIESHRPVSVAVEGIFFGKNPRSTAVLGHARGVILLAAADAGLPVAEYPPAEVKSAITGTGRATKEQVAYMVARLLRLASPPTPSDAADGVALALCHCFRGAGVARAAAGKPFSLRALAESRGVL